MDILVVIIIIITLRSFFKWLNEKAKERRNQRWLDEEYGPYSASEKVSLHNCNSKSKFSKRYYREEEKERRYVRKMNRKHNRK